MAWNNIHESFKPIFAAKRLMRRKWWRKAGFTIILWSTTQQSFLSWIRPRCFLVSLSDVFYHHFWCGPFRGPLAKCPGMLNGSIKLQTWIPKSIHQISIGRTTTLLHSDRVDVLRGSEASRNVTSRWIIKSSTTTMKSRLTNRTNGVTLKRCMRVTEYANDGKWGVSVLAGANGSLLCHWSMQRETLGQHRLVILLVS